MYIIAGTLYEYIKLREEDPRKVIAFTVNKFSERMTRVLETME